MILGVGVAVVLGAILVLRLNAFFALVAAALIVSFLAPGPVDEKVVRVTQALGSTAGKIGIPIAMAAVIGACLLASGAADRIVQASLGCVGEQRGSWALAGSGFVLAIPVFFDTVFYLLVPLARSLHHRTGKHYLRYLLALGAGGAIAHTMVPPTPGPLMVADQLGVDLGAMMLVGMGVGLPSLLIALVVAAWMDRTIVLQQPSRAAALPQADETRERLPRPGLAMAFLPILLPIVLISGRTLLDRLASDAGGETRVPSWLLQSSGVWGDPSLALSLSAVVALTLYWKLRQPLPAEAARLVEEALQSAGVIILITAAGGAFGSMLKVAQIGPAVAALFAESHVSGLWMLWLAFGLSSLLKVSQGSSTVAAITSSGMIAAMIVDTSLPFHRAYLASAIGCGALVGVWMNDSGFWIFCRMGGLTEGEALRTWTPILAITGTCGMLVTCGGAWLLPFAASG